MANAECSECARPDRGGGGGRCSLTFDRRRGSNAAVETGTDRDAERQRAALRMLVDRCPRLARLCYWAGSAAIALEELRHRRSFDLDFHTREALRDVRPILAELRQAFPAALEIVQPPDEFGSGFRAVLTLPCGGRIAIEVRSNYEDARPGDLIPASSAPGLQRVSLSRYLADKIQCVAERVEARDLVDIWAVLRAHPEMERDARELLAQQDAALLAERLLAWSDAEIAEDLAAYDDVDPADARAARDRLLAWLKEDSAGAVEL